MRVKCLAQEHNIVSPERARTWTARSGNEHTNHEATTPPRPTQTKSSIISAANNWTKRIVSIKITTDRTQTSLAGDVCSVDSHTITIGSVKMATSCLSAALYVLNNCLIHSRYVRHGIGKRQFFEVGKFLLDQVRNLVDILCM